MGYTGSMIIQQQENPSLMVYEIHIEGHLDEMWADWFDGLTIEPLAQGVTLLSGPVVDQAALFGILKKLHNLGLVLLSVTRQ